MRKRAGLPIHAVQAATTVSADPELPGAVFQQGGVQAGADRRAVAGVVAKVSKLPGPAIQAVEAAPGGYPERSGPIFVGRRNGTRT